MEQDSVRDATLSNKEEMDRKSQGKSAEIHRGSIDEVAVHVMAK